MAKKKINKYRAKKVEYKGITFDSKRELQCYLKFEDMLNKGEISNLQRQVPFVIIPAVYEEYVKHLKTKDKIERRCKQRQTLYIADFVYEDKDGKQVVVDAKGFRTKEYKLKKKIMLYYLGIDIVEV